jgi:hypothetical protein
MFATPDLRIGMLDFAVMRLLLAGYGWQNEADEGRDRERCSKDQWAIWSFVACDTPLAM